MIKNYIKTDNFDSSMNQIDNAKWIGLVKRPYFYSHIQVSKGCMVMVDPERGVIIELGSSSGRLRPVACRQIPPGSIL